MRYIYLHGFASSPASRKAQAFASAMLQRGVRLEIPALDRGDFENLTVTSQLSEVGELLDNKPARLIGSSMGGYLAALYASQHPEVDRLALLAPALQFAPRWQEMTGPAKIREWEESGWMKVYHYGTRTERSLGSRFLSDALQYPAEPHFSQPAIIFHGREDQTVPIRFSRQFVTAHPNTALEELDSDHELLNVIEHIVDAAVSFLLA